MSGARGVVHEHAQVRDRLQDLGLVVDVVRLLKPGRGGLQGTVVRHPSSYGTCCGS